MSEPNARGSGAPEKPPRTAPRPKVRLFVEGRYRKLVRDLPQTIFYCPECKGRGRRKGVECARCLGHGKISKDSVQELIERVALPRFRAWKSKFHGAGREDIDVRMLGTGRPFILEVINPKLPMADLREMEDAINRANAARMEVQGLQLVPRARVAELKETKHPKEYLLRIRPAAPPSAEILAQLVGKRLTIRQRTPERVVHRRADIDRERWVEVAHAEPIEGGDLRVVLRCEHGTYVKEIVSGEGGRTEPSLSGLLGTPCSCVELDVTGILEPEGT
jgi:tRNA pseudouridine synthase 10